ncbi:methyltransferase domain-containing protein [candidate division KSB3 bacterium]|uniref:Methyltransferase domain-containing protein n=1 Tax=candidate division KSB3 bacterium TaxID=2044937 RepID=A0A9D5JX38_9BACT|nr:methyltransferase domain-containing protein [candidate division KSB3 bacterium]MBD3325331.1 methyltransferase domain-containing protein [candidate division KSB3 bacterium]
MTKDHDPLRLNLGCGPQPPPQGWVNVDNALGAKFAKIPGFAFINHYLHVFKLQWDPSIVIHDLRTPFPWDDNSVDVIYSSHTLEHLTREEGRVFLSECARILRYHGLIRLLVPDLEVLVTRYRAGEVKADEFIDALVIDYTSAQDGAFRKCLAPFLRAPHKCLYDTPLLSHILGELGVAVTSKAPFESEIDDIRAIESAERTQGVIILEGRKISE